MSSQSPLSSEDAHGGGADRDDNTISPLPGEDGIPNIATRRRLSISKKGVVAVLLLTGGIVTVAAFSIHRFGTGGRRSENQEMALARNKPAAASAEPRRLEMPAPAPSPSPSAPRIPAFLPGANDAAEPIGVRRTGAAPQSTQLTQTTSPEDAPILLVSTRPPGPTSKAPGGHSTQIGGAPGTSATAPQTDAADPLAATSRNLEGYQRQLQGLLDQLTQSAELAAGQSGVSPAAGPVLGSATPHPLAANNAAAAGAAALLGDQLQGSITPKAIAGTLGDRSLTLPRGTAFTCALKTRILSATSGLVGCQVQRNVFSDDGRVLLIERGSHLDGEYRVTSVRPGVTRIPVLWTRIRTPLGVTVDIDSPATGPLGESGIEGHVDNRWTERIGAALLLSLIDDSVKLVIQNQANERQADTIVLPSTTANSSKLAEKVLDSTINIPPLIYQNQGGIVGIHVARDVDFSSVYELRPTTR